MQHTITDIMRCVTKDCLARINPTNPPSCDIIEGNLIDAMRSEIDFKNQSLAKNAKIKMPDTLAPVQIAEIMNHLYTIRRIPPADTSDDSVYDLLAVYQTKGPDEGIYVTSDEIFRNLAQQFKYALSTHDFKETMDALRPMVPRVARCKDPNIIPVNNGLFNYEKKELMPFTPDKVYLSKCRVNYNPNATNINIHNTDDGTDWNIESWIAELTDDPAVVGLLWQILGAIVRPFTSWNVAAWFYSQTGNNGKGTLCELMRELVGQASCASISLNDMNKDFALESLIHATAIIVDENDVGTFIDKAANVKSLITHDVVLINRKFKQMIPFRFYGLMVQCLNEMPRVKDKSESFYRRQVFIPFTKCFTGKERRYIKDEYLHRKEVLEYVLCKVLNMTYYELTVPDSCKEALEEYKKFNDPLRQFIDEILPECVWDLLPFNFLYDLYQAWYRMNFGNISGILSKTTFTNEIIQKTIDDPIWYCPNKNKQHRTKKRITKAEPLIHTYNLTNWMNPVFANRGPLESKCLPINLPDRMRGLCRRDYSQEAIDNNE